MEIIRKKIKVNVPCQQGKDTTTRVWLCLCVVLPQLCSQLFFYVHFNACLWLFLLPFSACACLSHLILFLLGLVVQLFSIIAAQLMRVIVPKRLDWKLHEKYFVCVCSWGSSSVGWCWLDVKGDCWWQLTLCFRSF